MTWDHLPLLSERPFEEGPRRVSVWADLADGPEVRFERDDVPAQTGGSVVGLDEDRLVAGGVTPVRHRSQAREELGVTVERHHARLQLRAHLWDPLVEAPRLPEVGQLRRLHPESCAWEQWVVLAVVVVQMGMHDQLDIARFRAVAGESSCERLGAATLDPKAMCCGGVRVGAAVDDDEVCAVVEEVRQTGDVEQVVRARTGNVEGAGQLRDNPHLDDRDLPGHRFDRQIRAVSSIPPSMTSIAPVTYDAAGEHR